MLAAASILGVAAWSVYNNVTQTNTHELVPKIKDPYHPVETGYQDQMLRRLPQHTYRSELVIGDVSEFNPLPYVNNNPDRGRLQETQWGHANVNRQLQVNQIHEKLNLWQHELFEPETRAGYRTGSWSRNNRKYPR